MPSRADIEAVIPEAGEAVFRATGVYPNGFGITGKAGELALSVTLHQMPFGALPDKILGIPAVFQVVEPPVFLGRRRRNQDLPASSTHDD